MSEFYAVTLVATALVFLAAFSSLIAFRFGAPLLLLFLTIGLGAGVDGLGIDFSISGWLTWSVRWRLRSSSSIPVSAPPYSPSGCPLPRR